MTKNYSEKDFQADSGLLQQLGYAQELERGLGRFSNFAISFSIICILAGGVNSLAQVTSGVGGAGVGIGWPLGCLVSGVFALAMAQIASAFPTSGGLYHWGSTLGGRFSGWLTAWLNLIGLVTVLGSINVGTYTFFMGSLGAHVGLEASYPLQIALVGGMTALQALVNQRGIRLAAKLTDLSGYLILGTAVLLTVLCLAYAKSWDVARLWTFANQSGAAGGDVWPQTDNLLMLFVVGLLLPVYTITGYDASAHVSEETRMATLAVPRAMIGSVVWSSLLGWLMLSAFVLFIPDMQEAAKQNWNVFFWALEAGMPRPVVWLLYAAILASQFLCGLATVTSTSRMMYAFARDGGLPFSAALSRVNPVTRVPTAAIWSASVLAVVFTAYTPVYTTVVSVTVIFIFMSFALPIALAFRAHGRSWTRMGAWDIGPLFKPIAALSVLAAGFIFFIGVQPPNDKALWITLAFLVVSAFVWLAFERRRFRGPPPGLSLPGAP